MKSSRIGVFGGTFDPVHQGHLQLAQQAISEINLCQLVFVPAAQPPHKSGNITPIKHRIAMLELLCQESENLVCSGIEKILPKPSYTVDTLRELVKLYPGNIDLYFIIGVDAFLDLMTWKSYLTILSMVQIVVSPRIGYADHFLHSFLNKIGYNLKDDRWQAEDHKKDIIVLSKPPQAVCSSSVRKVIENGGTTATMLHPAVADYIHENSLYKL
ncbi:MAG: nicotinate (nicotinamide) nucleotide adenylyltransferase [Desulfotalea sp.]|nr:MAG: nicotinate (nicotinamide) nucleotide adenylyltransferase [Desulfotalea sp.]